MGTSNICKLRKELAGIIEDEIFTINTDIGNVKEKLISVKLSELKRLNLDDLKSIRRSLQQLQGNIISINQRLETIGKYASYSGEVISVETSKGNSQEITAFDFLKAHRTGLDQAPVEVIDSIIKQLNR